LGKRVTKEVGLEFCFDGAEAGRVSDGGWERIEKSSKPRNENDLAPYDTKRARGIEREVVLVDLKDLVGL
jgi:hypothetical protein